MIGWLRNAILSIGLLSLIHLWPTASQELLWLSSDELPTTDAHEAIALLSSAGDDGLDASDYNADALSRLAARLEVHPDRSVAVSFDRTLTAAMLTLFRDLHAGRVDPRAAGCGYHIERDEPDYENLLREGIQRHQLDAIVARLRRRFGSMRHSGPCSGLTGVRRERRRATSVKSSWHSSA